MKRCILLIVLILIQSITVSAQIFTKKIVCDKFDDVLSLKNQKTLLSQNDSTITIEEKGCRKIAYRILGLVEENCHGSESNIVQLTDGEVYLDSISKCNTVVQR